MHHIHQNDDWDFKDHQITPEGVFLNRRQFMQGTGVLGALSAMALSGCKPGSTEVTQARPEIHPTALEKTLYPAIRNGNFPPPAPFSSERHAGEFNNFYEFSEIKQDVMHHAQALNTRPWTVEIGGLVDKPGVWDFDDLLKNFQLEERAYRLRCVEAWAMVVPWTGFPLKLLLDSVGVKSDATHVEFTSFHQPFTAQGQLAFWQPWPYSEAISVEEAINPLTLLATGIYGHPLPKQHGAPVRLVVPWKYGFKSIKSIVRIDLVDYRPGTFWNTLMPEEYGYVANVNPGVPHPRWPQNREKMIGTGEVVETKLFNGYGKYVAKLYPKEAVPEPEATPTEETKKLT